MRIFAVTVIILLLSTSTYAQIYKWVDKNGKTQYTDQPPPPGAAKEEQRLHINKSAPGSGNQDRARNFSEERDEFDKRRQQRREEEAQQQAKSEESKKKCIDAQTQLRIYTDSPRLTVPDGAGGLTYVDDDLRQRKIADASKAVATHCK
ncbi:MAG: DUF4124 domain-containing protein [Proteobacteria bacterium]|nr:DUF4124 domain-containing protein [Pseudomonadota bacterium]